MMNYIWGGMIIISLIVSVFTGHVEQTAAAAVSGAGDAVTLCCIFTFRYNVSMDRYI